MKLFAPKYYSAFKCIADKCKHNCCIGWEIDIDNETLEKYLALDGGYGEEIKRSVDDDPTPHFRLGYRERCPHLSENGLCRIITELSESYLCEICREHPRFYNFTSYGAEVGLGMACEEACGMILRSDLFNELEIVCDMSGEAEELDFDPIPLRQRIFDVLSDSSGSHSSKLNEIFGICSEKHREYSDEEIRNILLSLEYMDAESKAIICDYTQHTETESELEKPLERALAYFVYRHLTKAEDEWEFEQILRFALLCYSILRSIAWKKSLKTVDELIPYARMLSEELEYSEDNTITLIERINA
jgi:lysine-N-methylase